MKIPYTKKQEEAFWAWCRKEAMEQTPLTDELMAQVESVGSRN